MDLIEKKPANGVDNAGEWLDAANETGVLTTGPEGKISVSGLTKGVYAFVETGVNAEDGYILIPALPMFLRSVTMARWLQRPKLMLKARKT